MTNTLERYKSLIRPLLTASIATLSISCADSRDEPHVEQRVLHHGYQQYLNGRYDSSWKSYIDTIYYFQEQGVLEPNAYILASALCVHAYHWNANNEDKKRCISFFVSDPAPNQAVDKRDILRTSIKYLQFVNDHHQLESIQRLIRCHEAALHQGSFDCELVDEGLVDDLLG